MSQNIHRQIEALLLSAKRLPEKIVVPPEMFEAFAADVASTGHAETVWGQPVVAGDVTEITLVWPPLPAADSQAPASFREFCARISAFFVRVVKR